MELGDAGRETGAPSILLAAPSLPAAQCRTNPPLFGVNITSRPRNRAPTPTQFSSPGARPRRRSTRTASGSLTWASPRTRGCSALGSASGRSGSGSNRCALPPISQVEHHHPLKLRLPLSPPLSGKAEPKRTLRARPCPPGGRPRLRAPLPLHPREPRPRAAAAAGRGVPHPTGRRVRTRRTRIAAVCALFARGGAAAAGARCRLSMRACLCEVTAGISAVHAQVFQCAWPAGGSV